MVNPSHQSVEAGVEPPPQVGAAARTVVLVIASVEPSSSKIGAPRDPHKVAMARPPASHSAAVALESKVKKSGLEYSVSAFNILSVATP